MSRTGFQLIVIGLLVLILAALVVPAYLNHRREREPLFQAEPGMFPKPPSYSDFQRKMMASGYIRNKEDHRWYSIMGSWRDHRCQSAGPPLEATFYLCQSPLTGGIADQK
jgi:hypothetical protein